MGRWALAAAALACAAAAASVGHAEKGHDALPPSALQPPKKAEASARGVAAGEEQERTSKLPSRQSTPGEEECEQANGWSSSSFVGGIAIGISLTLLLTVLPAVYFRQQDLLRNSAEEEAEKGNTKEDASSEAFGAKSAKKLEAEPGMRRATEPSGESAKGEAPAKKGCTDEVESMHLFWPRAGFLVVMLLVQSISSVILGGFEGLIENHTDLVFFLTMIVGLGGNAGGQSMVLSVRGLATGHQVYTRQQLLRGLLLSLVLVPLAFFRVLIQHGSLAVAFTVAISCLIVLATSTSCGTSIPRILLALKIDPAHGAAIIQVLMDIGGIAIVCAVAVIVLGV